MLSFPAPPAISFSLRQLFTNALMAVLCRDVYFQLQLDEPEPPNDALDEVLTAYLGFDYATPPASFMHVEHVDGNWRLHTRIAGAPDATPPIAEDFHVSVPRITTPIGRGLVVNDVFLYGREQTYPIALCTLELEQRFAPDFDTLVYLRRSDTAVGLVDFRLVERRPIQVSILPAGLTWQVFLFVSGAPETIPPIWFRGRLWFTDTQGNQSNHAFWSIAGQALIALPFSITKLLPNFPGSNNLFVSDVFVYATRALAPITMGHLTMPLAFTNDGEVFVHLVRSDDAGDGVALTTTPGLVYNLPVLPPGITWQLKVLVTKTPPEGQGAFFSGDWWVEDAAGAVSNIARWRISCVQVF